MKVKSQRDLIAGVLFTLIGVAFAIGSRSYNFGASSRPGPGYFPLLLGIVLAGLGVMTMFESVLRRKTDAEGLGSIAWRPVLVIIGAITLFGFLLPRMGLFISLPLLIVLSGFASAESKLTVTLINAVVLTLGSWAIFVWGLGLTIPLWPDFIGG